MEEKTKKVILYPNNLLSMNRKFTHFKMREVLNKIQITRLSTSRKDRE